ncbi:hypothetical protein SLEP1_g53053 [Rubroshorea leprosula]|uniref:Uncharacterized protein n=1 Tax=Rubroshorea leprosula TaxID=152421 RepID=A0AAV5MB01_9ROSI|nr:hypothetical protein SLEP1_g53053 [Rubroshorea leprosula]
MSFLSKTFLYAPAKEEEERKFNEELSMLFDMLNREENEANQYWEEVFQILTGFPVV